MKLYVYDHCPFCVKARAIFGLKGLPFELFVMLNDDAATPERMIGRKMAPIFEHEGRFTPEGMDIVRLVDAMAEPRALAGPNDPAVSRWIDDGSPTLYRLAIPRWAAAPLAEFATTDARAFFTRNKQAAVGPFSDSLAETDTLVAAMDAHLVLLEPLMRSPDAVNDELSEGDITCSPSCEPSPSFGAYRIRQPWTRTVVRCRTVPGSPSTTASPCNR